MRAAPLQRLTWLIERTKQQQQQHNIPNPKKNIAAVDYQDPVKTELLKGTGLL